MTIAPASNNGGRINTVHRQTDDGIVFSVAMGESLVPIVFTYKDYLGDIQSNLLASSFYPHKRLMRGDCGWRVKDDSAEYLFSWQAMEHVTDGFTESPSGEYSEAWHEEPNCAKDVQLEGHRGHRRTFYRQDREYWTPDHVLQAEAPVDIFGPTPEEFINENCLSCGDYIKEPTKYTLPTFHQWNPESCPPKAPNSCGIVEFGD